MNTFSLRATWHVTTLTSFSLMLMLVGGCSTKKPAHENVRIFLERCPDWTRLDPSDHKSRQIVVLCLERISTNDIREIRTGVEEYVREHSHPSQIPNVDNREGKVFVLNRYLFNVAQMGTADSPAFTPWHSPIRNGHVDNLWPLSLGTEGRLALTGIYTGYTGEAYRAIDEFDFLLKTYGLRKGSWAR